MADARYWRVVGMETYGGGALLLSGLHLYFGATRVCAGALISATLAPDAGAVSALQDVSAATDCAFSASAVRVAGFAIVWDFGGAPADVDALRFGAADEKGTFAARCHLQSSSNGVTWSNALTIGPVPWPGARTMTASIGSQQVWGERWSESFVTGIPAGFADTLTDAGALSVSWDAANEAVVADATGYNTAWMPVQEDARVMAGLEIDFELLADNGLTRRIGVVFSGGPTLLQNVININGALIESYQSTGASVLGLAAPILHSSSFTVPSGRNTLRCTSAPSAAERTYTVSMGASSATFSHAHTGAAAQLKCGIFLRGLKARIYSIRSLFGGGSGLVARSVNLRALCAASAPVPAFSTRRTAPLQLARDVEVGGPGTIYGTTKTKGTPNVPTKARVVLLHQRSKLPARETWSDPVTGNFAFAGIDTTQQFLTLADDAAGNFRPVAANRLAPEVLP